MVESMTGFGRGTSSAAGIEATVEVRSVNGRYVEVAVRAPRELGAQEVEIQNRARAALQRGKITVAIEIERSAVTAPMQVNEKVARAYADVLDQLRLVAGVRQPIELDHLLQFKDVLVAADAPDLASIWPVCSEAVDAALADCRSMRRREGEALAVDLLANLSAIEEQLSIIEAASPERVATARDTLRERLAELLGDETRVDADRLEVEIAILADRLDVNEECVRLRSHLEQFREAIESSEQSGRRLNFLAQEIGREINTISSKANDATIAHRAVSMKEELEKIREQVQNIA